MVMISSFGLPGNLDNIDISGASLAQNAPFYERLLEPGEFTYVGSGGNADQLLFTLSSGALTDIRVERGETGSRNVVEQSPLSIAQIEDYICSTFDLTIKDLADSCGVTRRTIYNWREATQPQISGASRLFKLYRAARDWSDAGYPGPGQHLREPLLGGRSLFDLLKEGSLDLDAIDFIGSRLAFAKNSMNERASQLQDPF